MATYEELSMGKPGVYKYDNGFEIILPPIEFEMTPDNYQWCLEKFAEARKNNQTPSDS